MGTASSLALGIVGLILLLVGIVMVIYGIINLIEMAWIAAIIYIVIGAVLIWVGYDVIGLPTRTRA